MSLIENPYATPQADLNGTPARTPVFFVVSPGKFLTLMLLTFGGYFFFWLYQQWALYRQATAARLWPWVRMMFPGCYFCSLILCVMRELEQGESDYRWWPRCLAVAVFVGGCLPFTLLWLLSPFVALAVAAGIAVCLAALALHVQRAINALEFDPLGQGNAQLTGANWLGIAAGVMGWAVTMAWGLRAVSI